MTGLIEVSHIPFLPFFFGGGTFIKACDSETRKGLGQQKPQERAQAGISWLTGKSEKRGPWRQDQEGCPG